MRNILFTAFLLISLSGYTASIPSVSGTMKENPESRVIPPSQSISAKNLATLKVRDYEKMSGRKLSLKEKFAFKLMQVKLKKDLKKKSKGEYSSRSKTAFILSILSLATMLLIPLSVVLSVISIILASKSLKANPEDKKAKTAMGLSILALGIIVVGLLIYGIFVSDGAFKLFVIN
jgi:hypothetical protein